MPRRPWKNSWSKTREDKTGQLIAMKQWANRQVVLVGFLFLAFLLYLAWASSRGDLAIRNTALARMGERVAVSGTLVNQSRRSLSLLTLEVSFFDSEHNKIGEAPVLVREVPPRSEVRFSTEALPFPKAAHYQLTLP